MTDRTKFVVMALILAIGIILALAIGAYGSTDAGASGKQDRQPWKPWQAEGQLV